jgi:hypothetical protein
MTTIVFDTLKFANRLKEAGFTEQQAAVITELQCETVVVTLEQAREDYHLDEIATKRDLKELELALRKEIELLRAETKKDIAETGRSIAEAKAELIRWVVGAGLLQSTLIIGVLLKIGHLI